MRVSLMNAQAYRMPSTRGLLIVAGCSAAMAAFILFGQFEYVSRLWGSGLILLAAVLLAWKYLSLGTLGVARFDEWAWAIMMSHTVIIHVQRDLRILAEDFTPSAE